MFQNVAYRVTVHRTGLKGKENHCYFTGKRLWWKDLWLCRVTGQNHTNWLCFMQNWSVSILWKKRLHWNRKSSSRRIRWNERNYNKIWIENGYYAKKSKINCKNYKTTKYHRNTTLCKVMWIRFGFEWLLKEHSYFNTCVFTKI